MTRHYTHARWTATMKHWTSHKWKEALQGKCSVECFRCKWHVFLWKKVLTPSGKRAFAKPLRKSALVLCLCHFNNHCNHFKTTTLWHPSRGNARARVQRAETPGEITQKTLTNVTGYFIQSWWILNISHDEHLPPEKELFLQNVPRNIEPPEASTNPGGGEINKNTI